MSKTFQFSIFKIPLQIRYNIRPMRFSRPVHRLQSSSDEISSDTVLCNQSNTSQPSQRHLRASLEMSHVPLYRGKALRKQMCRVTAATRGERGREAGSEGGMGRRREGWMGARVSGGLLLHL